MSFYTTNGTLLFQGKDEEDIKAKFYHWRQERLQSFEKEYDSLYSAIPDEGPARKRQKVGETKERASIQSMREELHSYCVPTDRFLERSEFEKALYDARKSREKKTNGDGASSLSRQRSDDRHAKGSKPSCSFSQHTSANKRPFGRPSGEGACKYCNRWISKHKQFEGDTMCVLSGKYECSCGRWWWGMALKIQQQATKEKGAFPPHTFPDCMTCKDNSNVELKEHTFGDASTERTGRGHQHRLCPMCKKGEPCHRA